MILGITGYRPDKLPDKATGYNIPNPTYLRVCQELDKHFRAFKPNKIIIGMALGADQYAAMVAYKLKIPYLAAIPFNNQESKWNLQSQKTYQLLRKLATEEVIVSPGDYAAWKMQVRNEFIVNSCDLLLAVMRPNEISGGTYNCVQYAKQIGREILIIDPRI